MCVWVHSNDERAVVCVWVHSNDERAVVCVWVHSNDERVVAVCVLADEACPAPKTCAYRGARPVQATPAFPSSTPSSAAAAACPASAPSGATTASACLAWAGSALPLPG